MLKTCTIGCIPLFHGELVYEPMNYYDGDSSASRHTNLNKARVSIVIAHGYDRDLIHAAVKKGVELIGGLERIVPPGSKVFVKINHLSPASPPEKGIVTHPVFVEAVLELLKMVSADITVGDDIDSDAGDGFQISGFRQMCERAGVRLVNLREAGFVETGCNGHFLDKVYLSRIAVDADVIVNLPKLKTHSLTVFTGGVKNMYGTIPSGLRRKLHGDYIRSEDFSQALTDIFSAIRPQLTIMDGIVAMEGEGPASGNLRSLGVILTSRDTLALDTVATKIIGLNPRDVYTTRYSEERGLGIGSLENIEVLGERIDSVAVINFKHPAAAINVLMRLIPTSLPGLIFEQLSIKLRVKGSQCTGCGECVKACPAGAISMSGEIAKINHDICIKCMCCDEVCRFYAIAPSRSIAGSIINCFANIFRKLPRVLGKALYMGIWLGFI